MTDSASRAPAATEDLIAAARRGGWSALGRLLDDCRPYLLLIANQELPPDLWAKAGPSDLVQETFLEAQRDFAQFRGGTEAELLAWLRALLVHNLDNFTRGFRAAAKRDVAREVAIPDAPLGELYDAVVAGSQSP